MYTAIALLRAINVSGHNRVPMQELRSLCSELGWSDVQSYIQSGNLIFRAEGSPLHLEQQLEEAIERRFQISVPVLVRRPQEWLAYVESNPYSELVEGEPNRVMLALSKSKPTEGAVSRLQARAGTGERIEQVGEALWIYFGTGAGSSKLTPGLLDRVVGSPVTTRNWRTVIKLQEMAAAYRH